MLGQKVQTRNPSHRKNKKNIVLEKVGRANTCVLGVPLVTTVLKFLGVKRMIRAFFFNTLYLLSSFPKFLHAILWRYTPDVTAYSLFKINICYIINIFGTWI